MKPYRITIHCSASPNGRPCPASKIKELHTAPKNKEVYWFGKQVKGFNFSDIGYHIIAQPDGGVEYGRALNAQGAHVKGDNEGNVGICLIGNDLFTKRQFEALRYKLNGIRMTYNIPIYNIHCHYEFPSAITQGKSCPNIRAVNLVTWYIQDDWEPLLSNLLD